MSALPCGLAPVDNHFPTPWLSLEPPPRKMSSLVELTASVTKLEVTAPLRDGLLLSAKTWSQSCEVAVEPDEPSTPVTLLPSSSKVPRTLGVMRVSSCSTRREQRR